MIDTIYIEEEVADHWRTLQICERFPRARKITCGRYGEVFNPKAQNFRLQKIQPALILAKKWRNFVLAAPAGYGIGSDQNYYFSHMLNCLYDCRYCFLQGMYRSANYVVFVNFEDFENEIESLASRNVTQNPYFFSGYDCDSLVMDPITGFADTFLDLFQGLNGANLEIRTKSTQIRSLTAREPIPNCVVAFSFTPRAVANELEHRVPPTEKRLAALIKLYRQGWQIGLRFDPMIYEDNYQANYQQLFSVIFSEIDGESLHSVSLGSFRLPQSYFRKIKKLYPDEKLFAGPLQLDGKMMAYQPALESEMMQFCSETLLNYVPRDKLFPCR